MAKCEPRLFYLCVSNFLLDMINKLRRDYLYNLILLCPRRYHRLLIIKIHKLEILSLYLIDKRLNFI